MKDILIRCLFLGHVGATLYMVGVIWFVQIVHYPLFAAVGRAEFPAYAQLHAQRTTWVVMPPMLLEAAAAVLLVWFRPPGISHWLVWAGLGLLLVIWFSTFFVQVPCHEKLADGFDPAVHRRLCRTNWIRTVAWSLRGLLVLGMCWKITWASAQNAPM